MRTIVKYCVIATILLAVSVSSKGQIKVSSNNYVSINYNSTPLSRFVINHAGHSAYQAYIYNPMISTSGAALLTLSEKGTSSGCHLIGLNSHQNIGGSNSY